MNIRAPTALALVFALSGTACYAPAPSTTTNASTAAPETTHPSTTTVTTRPASAQATAGMQAGDATRECDSFTIRLDRFVFNRLQPIVEEAADLLHSAPDAVDPADVAERLSEAGRQLAELVEELDLMGVPPREVVDLLLSIREGTRLYATSFERGAQGWRSGNTDLIAGARDGVREASAVMTEFFGWQLCG